MIKIRIPVLCVFVDASLSGRLGGAAETRQHVDVVAACFCEFGP